MVGQQLGNPRLIIEFDVVILCMALCSGIEELIGDTHLFETNIWIALFIRGRTSDDILDRFPAQSSIFIGRGLALNQFALGAMNRHDIHPIVTAAGRALDFAKTALLPERRYQALKIIPPVNFPVIEMAARVSQTNIT